MPHLLTVLALCASIAGASDDPDRAALRAALLHGPAMERLAPAPLFLAGGQRSVPLAFGLSAVLPGAGQAYNRQWTKAAIAVAIEAVVITSWIVRRNDGLQAHDDVEAFAQQGWNPGRYSDWLTDYADYLVQEFDHTVTAPPPDVPAGIDFSSPGSWTAAERQAVDDFFNQIRSLERQLYHVETGASFSHVLPYYGEQQYYELIGKYFQFAPGWGDYPDWTDGDGNYTAAIDPELTGTGGSKPNVSVTFYDYAKDHARAQDILRQASRISMLLVVNHLLAGIDAAVSAKLHNDRLDASFGVAYDPHGPPRPAAVLRYRF